MQVAILINEYLRVLLAWPVMTAVIGLTAMVMFKADIKLLLTRIKTMRFPGGSEVETSQLVRTRHEEITVSSDSVEVAPPASQTALPEQLRNQSQEIQELYRSERIRAALWEYRYLNYFLVLNTQLVLDWLATTGKPVSLSLFHTFLTPFIPLPQERDAVLNVLSAHYLVFIENELITVSPKGEDYLRWRGPLPLPQAAKN